MPFLQGSTLTGIRFDADAGGCGSGCSFVNGIITKGSTANTDSGDGSVTYIPGRTVAYVSRFHLEIP